MNIITKQEENHMRILLLDCVADFCEKNNINYFLGFGTLLGAIREGKIIDWDYDLDIIMLREDYERFISTFKTDNKKYRLSCHSIDHKTQSRLCILYNSETINIDERVSELSPSKHVNIEIYPFDNVPEDKKRRDKLFKKVEFYSKVFYAKTMRLSSERTFLKNCVLLALKTVFFFYSTDKILDKIDYYSKLKKDNETTLVAPIVVGKGGLRSLSEKSIWKEYEYASFEGKKYRIPVRYDEFLKIRYGDYLKIPSEEEIAESMKEQNRVAYRVITDE